MDVMYKLANALRVLTECPETRDWLELNDPMALKQAQEALAAMPRPCLFPGSHEETHPADMKFHVIFHGSDQWEDLTEAEIMARPPVGFMHSSQWDFWWEV
jgi:hypothetical protein